MSAHSSHRRCTAGEEDQIHIEEDQIYIEDRSRHCIRVKHTRKEQGVKMQHGNESAVGLSCMMQCKVRL